MKLDDFLATSSVQNLNLFIMKNEPGGGIDLLNCIFWPYVPFLMDRNEAAFQSHGEKQCLLSVIIKLDLILSYVTSSWRCFESPWHCSFFARMYGIGRMLYKQISG